MDIRGNNGNVQSILIYSFIEKFSEKISPFLLKIPQYFPDLTELILANNHLNTFPNNYFTDLRFLESLSLVKIKISVLPSLNNCRNLKILGIHDAFELQGILSLSNLTKLEKLYIKNAPKLQSLPPFTIENPEQITTLKTNVKSLETEYTQCTQNLKNMRKNLSDEIMKIDYSLADVLDRRAEIEDLEKYMSILLQKRTTEIRNITSLKEIIIEDTPELQSLPSFDNLILLNKIRIRNAPKLLNLPSIRELKYLSRIALTNLGITTLPNDYSRLNRVCDLYLIECNQIQTLPPSICELRSIYIRDCSDLRSLPEKLLENPENLPLSEITPYISVFGLIGSPKLQVSDEMRKRVEIHTPEEWAIRSGPGGVR
jgi:hypothetical protein